MTLYYPFYVVSEHDGSYLTGCAFLGHRRGSKITLFPTNEAACKAKKWTLDKPRRKFEASMGKGKERPLSGINDVPSGYSSEKRLLFYFTMRSGRRSKKENSPSVLWSTPGRDERRHRVW
jgi:hypothetical protein